MRERINLGAYWGDRRESVDECAGRVLTCLRQLAASDEAFGQWFQGGKSREEALERRFNPTVESLRDLLMKGRNRRDSDKSVIDQLGYSMGLWSGREDDSAINVSFFCGAYPVAPRMETPNNCVINLPYSGPMADRIFQEEKLRCIMSAVVDSWNPDWARVTTFEVYQAIYPELYSGVKVGWLTYLSDRYGPLPKLPDDCEVTRIADLGNVIILKGVDRLTATNPQHVAAVRRLSDVLNAAGLLAPMPPRVAT